MKNSKKTFGIISLSLLLLTLSGCYYVTEGCNLIQVYSKAKDIDTLLADESLPQDERELLMLVKDIKTFATTRLGLVDNKNYSSYVKIEQDYLVDVVSACSNDSFTQYNWDYLFVGKMPYRGFFKHEDAVKEAEKLKQEGYDVYLRQVDAFSTLGFFKDPVFSFMKEYSIYYLANIIIHEQTHATFFINGNIDFSENLAHFFGNEGAKQYLKETYGEQSEILARTILLENDIKKYHILLKELYDELDSIYNSGLSKEQKLESKAAAIKRWQDNFAARYTSTFKTDAFISVPEFEMNNAFLATHMNYSSNLDLFYTLYEVCSYDLVKVMQVVKGAKDYKGDAFAYLEEYILNATKP
ncbi:MAG: aminopeptidase [Spirochaetales bacterium]|nr:aminopeptidase [Spirochaetales bacterium]